MSVFVLDTEGKPLLPTCEARARLLLNQGKAIMYSIVPFTISLKRKVGEPTGDFKVGIDDGALQAGISIAYGSRVVFAGNIKLRNDVHRKMLQRAQYRRARRNRNLKHRQARFLNRGVVGGLPPTIKQKKESILRVIDDLRKRINITSECVVEQGAFDVSSMGAGHKLTRKEYQKSEYEGNNWRQKVLWRDSYVCQQCGSKETLQAHHINGRSKGGTNIVKNGVTLCKVCHDLLHSGNLVWEGTVKHFKYPAHLQQGKWWLFNELKKRFTKVKVCYGWMTARARRDLGLEKDHHLDASAMIGANVYYCKPYIIIPKRTKVWENNPTKTCEEKNGFRHWDVVKAAHRIRTTVVGSVKSLKARCMTLRTHFDDNFAVSYSKTKLLWRPSKLVYINFN